MRAILYRVLTNPTGYKIICTLTFIPIMVGLSIGIRWFVATFGTGVSLAAAVPFVLFFYVLGRFFERY